MFRKFCDVLDSKAENAEDNFSWEEVRTEQENCTGQTLMDWLNNGSLVLFLVGAVLLLSFTGFNL